VSKPSILFLGLSAALALPSMASAQSTDDVGGVLRAPQASPIAARPAIATKDVLAGAGSFTGAEPVMSPRFFRDGSNIEGEGCSTFSSGNFQYQEFPFTTDGSGTLTATVDNNTCGTNMFVTFHDGAFNPASICDNHFYDFGSSTSFSQAFSVPANTEMVMVVSGVANAPGVVCDFSYSLDGIGGAVQLTPSGSNNPVAVAEELVIPPARTFVNDGRLDIETTVEYAFSPGEVRYARLHCPGVSFDPASTVTFSGDPSNLIGSVNTSADGSIYFSITAGATPVLGTDTLLVDGNRTVNVEAPVDCTYGLYDFPSQAQAGGSTGRVATTSGAYLRFAPSYALRVDNQGNPVANVESEEPTYSEFVLGAPTFSILRGQVGGFSYGTAAQVLGGSQPITLDGAAVELVDLMDADTALVFSGDFEAAGDVFFSPAPDCSVNIQSADSFDDTEAVFTIGSNAAMNHFLCYEAGGDPIRASEFTVSLAPVSADPATYAVGGRGPLDLGVITRNGTELQAPLAQVPANYLSRMVLTNTGSQDRPYEVAVLGEAGNVISTANLTGTVPAGGTKVVDLTSVLTGFTAAPRATLNVTVAGPNGQIQGLYQIVNPDSGTISNHVMVRPGLN
jgi:hypothetical protein